MGDHADASVVGSRGRDRVVDLLRVFALGCIVLAHCGVRGALFQVRIFDVVCMAMLSGMSYRLAGSKGRGGLVQYGAFVKRRAKRLLVPTWTILTVLFAIEGMVALLGISPWVGWRAVARSYLLIDGIGYVWIVRVYLLLAVASPAIALASDRIPGDRSFMAVVALLLLFLLGLLHVPTADLPEALGWVWTDCFLYLFGYGIVAFVGYRHHQMSFGARMTLAAGLALIAVCFFAASGGAALSDFKYPPHPYYLCYGCSVSLVMYELLSMSRLTRLRESRAIDWLSRNSFWIYLWHVVPVRLLPQVSPALAQMDGATGVMLRWTICTCFAVVATAVQNLLGVRKAVIGCTAEKN